MSAKPGKVAGFTRRMSRFPAIEEDWEARPYFLWDTDMSWRNFQGSLHDQDRVRRVWALERLLREANWADIWRLITVADLAKDFHALSVPDAEFWRLFLEVTGETA